MVSSNISNSCKMHVELKIEALLFQKFRIEHAIGDNDCNLKTFKENI